MHFRPHESKLLQPAEGGCAEEPVPEQRAIWISAAQHVRRSAGACSSVRKPAAPAAVESVRRSAECGSIWICATRVWKQCRVVWSTDVSTQGRDVFADAISVWKAYGAACAVWKCIIGGCAEWTGRSIQDTDVTLWGRVWRPECEWIWISAISGSVWNTSSCANCIHTACKSLWSGTSTACRDRSIWNISECIWGTEHGAVAAGSIRNSADEARGDSDDNRTRISIIFIQQARRVSCSIRTCGREVETNICI